MEQHSQQKCNSTKEELRVDGHKNVDDCPVCLRHDNFRWAVGDHRSAPAPAPAPATAPAPAPAPGNYPFPVNIIKLFPSHISCIFFCFDENLI